MNDNTEDTRKNVHSKEKNEKENHQDTIMERSLTYTLNHLGIVAGACKELKIAETIDKLIPPDPQQKVTT